MKNPFLDDRKPFSSVKSPIIAKKQLSSATQRQDSKQIRQTAQYGINKNKQFQDRSNTNNVKISNQIGQMNRYGISEKMTFGDPLSSDAHNNQRTSGYFNVMNSQNSVDNYQTHEQSQRLNNQKYNRFEYEQSDMTKMNHYNTQISNQNYKNGLNQLPTESNIRQKKQFQQQYEFRPPPINSFGTSLQNNNYQYKPSNNNYTYNDKNQPIKTPNQRSYFKSPPKPQQSYESINNKILTPKHNQYEYQHNITSQLSPIGQVSRHKINQESFNFQGLMNTVDIQKLLAESKTQDQLIKLLGMDSSGIGKRHNNFIKKQQTYHNQLPNYNHQRPTYNHQLPTYNRQLPTYNHKPTNYHNQQTNYSHQRANYQNLGKTYQLPTYDNLGYKNQIYNEKQIKTKNISPYEKPSLQFNKKQAKIQIFQNQYEYQDHYEQQQPKVFNYAGQATSSRIMGQQKDVSNHSYLQYHQDQSYIFKASNNNMFKASNNNAFKQSNDNMFKHSNNNMFKTQNDNMFKTSNNNLSDQKSNQKQDQYDLQKIIQKQMQKYVFEQQRLDRRDKSVNSKNRKIFLTTTQKIYTHKYNLLQP